MRRDSGRRKEMQRTEYLEAEVRYGKPGGDGSGKARKSKDREAAPEKLL